MPMTSYKSVLAAFAAVVLVTACAKKEEEPAADVSVDVTTDPAPAQVEVVVPADPAATDGNSTDAEQSGGDKVSDPEPPPSGN